MKRTIVETVRISGHSRSLIDSEHRHSEKIKVRPVQHRPLRFGLVSSALAMILVVTAGFGALPVYSQTFPDRLESSVSAAPGSAVSFDAGLRLDQNQPSPGRAFLLSLALPGLGHRYANGGAWGSGGTFFVLVDGLLWTSLANSIWKRGQAIDNYRLLAVTGAGADVDGKDRIFFLRLASYQSSDEFTETSLRNRAWDEIGYADDPSFQWNWDSQDEYLRYREVREESETLGRRRTVLAATLVANRLLAGFLAARNARRAGAPDLMLSIRPPTADRTAGIDLAYRF
jgi:hypothetical protein